MIEWSETDLLIRDSIREFIDKEIRPNIDALESGEMTPYPIIRKLFSSFGVDVMATEAVNVLLEKQGAKDAAREAGEPLTTSRTKEPGGSPLGGQESLGLIAIKELAGVSLGLVASVGVSLGLGAATILSRGTLAQKKRWLPELVTFEKVAAWAITEPDSGSDAFGGMKTYVKRDGADYLLNGQKTFITNGPNADKLIVYAKLDEGDGAEKRDRKVLAFVLDSGMAGLTQSPAFKKMGMNSSPTGELFSTTSGSVRTDYWGRPRTTPAVTAGKAPARTLRPSAWGWLRCRSGSSRSVCGCAPITRRPARCGGRRSGGTS